MERRQRSLWPSHPQPLTDELLSSWLVRLAHANGIKVQTFYAGWLGRDAQLWNRDIDRSAPQEFINALSAATGIAAARIAALSLDEFRGFLSEEVAPGGHADWLMPVGVRHRLRKSFGLMFCQSCIREDDEPYMRRRWRLAFVTCCTKHRHFLRDRCGHCQSPQQPHRADMVVRRSLALQVTMARCAHCGIDLRRGATPAAAPDKLIAFQRSLEQALGDGHIGFAGNNNLHSVLFFSGLRAIARGLLHLRRDPPGTLPRAWVLEKLPLDRRQSLCLELAEVMQDWPRGFIQRCAPTLHPFRHFTGERASTPFWLYRICDLELRKGAPRLSAEEVAYIEAQVEAIDGRFTTARSRAMFGRDVGHARSKARVSVQEEDVEQLMAHLDHRIAETVGGRERLDHLRDKVIFATGRVFKLTQAQLTGLKLVDMVDAAATSSAPPTGKVPTTPIELQQYLQWYAKEVRPFYPAANRESWLFLCSTAHGQLSKSLIGARFTSAVQSAGLGRRIKSFADWTHVERSATPTTRRPKAVAVRASGEVA